uniref:Saposin B-type domain-containing protein n=1 Tax=Caenorhabditis tropicalis TaxID=1561998 RepID=A0A1I7T0J8_9PELO
MGKILLLLLLLIAFVATTTGLENNTQADDSLTQQTDVIHEVTYKCDIGKNETEIVDDLIEKISQLIKNINHDRPILDNLVQSMQSQFEMLLIATMDAIVCARCDGVVS